MTQTVSHTKKCGFVAIAGSPNAGKSTLINKLVGHKVSITTPKVQTTRFSILGISQYEHSQLVFVDTAGLFIPHDDLQKTMVDSAWSKILDADCIIYLIDVHRFVKKTTLSFNIPDIHAHLQKLSTCQKPIFLALNKIDLVDRKLLLPIISHLQELGTYEDIFLLSAKTGDGTLDIKKKLAQTLPESEWFFDSENITNISSQLYAEELTREKMFLRFHQELPYELHIETESWEKTKKNDLLIHQTIFVSKESQKKIILSEKGEILKKIGQTVRKELEYTFDTKVHLFLHVKTHPHLSKKIQNVIYNNP